MIYRGINWNDKSFPITPNFVVGEVSNWDDRRLVSDPRVADNAIALARELQKARQFFARPIVITSWYRPPHINREIGGAANSQHLTANAADLYVANTEFAKMLAIFRRNWSGHLFSYRRSGFLHVDRRAGGQWAPNSTPAFYQELE